MLVDKVINVSFYAESLCTNFGCLFKKKKERDNDRAKIIKN